MDNETVRINARSHRQALDWSLVLVSQGIECILDYKEDENTWGLIVPTAEQARALDTIKQYRLENRAWRWRRQVLQPGLIFDGGSLAWVFLLACFYMVDAQIDFRASGYMSSEDVAHGAWWRLFTAVWLHADLGHLAANATLGVLLLGLAMGRYGTGVGLLLAYLAGVGGNVAALLFSWGPHHSLGASGMVMGCLGLLAVQSLWDWRSRPHNLKWTLGGAAAGLMLFVLLGLSPNSDVLAHFGGFVSGLLLGAMVCGVKNLSQKLRVNILAGVVFVLLVILPWGLALKGSSMGAAALGR